MAPLVTVDVLPAKVAQTIAVALEEEPVIFSNAAGHITEETEWSVGQDSAIGLQELDGLVSEVPDVVHAGLVGAVEVLWVRTCG